MISLKNNKKFLVELFMNSPEQMGGSSGEPKNEPDYAVEWEGLRRGAPALAIIRGREIGVPSEEIARFADEVVARETASGNYDLVYRFRRNMKIGTETEIRAAGERAYQSFFEARDFGSAMAVAEDVYGRDSEEWKRASAASEVEWQRTEKRRRIVEDEERDLVVFISLDATFADLFKAIDAMEEEVGEGKFLFEEELRKNFGSEIAEEVLAFRDARASEGATTRVLDFFRGQGFSRKQVSIFLPIKFGRKRKGK
ncbi:MAG: hypothetical protein Q8N69_03255 [bacterium]|nr:hypothetical protein [bacterium]